MRRTSVVRETGARSEFQLLPRSARLARERDGMFTGKNTCAVLHDARMTCDSKKHPQKTSDITPRSLAKKVCSEFNVKAAALLHD